MIMMIRGRRCDHDIVNWRSLLSNTLSILDSVVERWRVTELQIDRQTDRQKDRQIDRHTDRQTDRQTDRLAHSLVIRSMRSMEVVGWDDVTSHDSMRKLGKRHRINRGASTSINMKTEHTNCLPNFHVYPSSLNKTDTTTKWSLVVGRSNKVDSSSTWVWTSHFLSKRPVVGEVD